jgi:hypothetical protein
MLVLENARRLQHTAHVRVSLVGGLLWSKTRLLVVLFVRRCLQAAARAAAVVYQSDHSALHSLPEAQLRMRAEQVGLALVAAAVAVLQGVMSCLSSR